MYAKNAVLLQTKRLHGFAKQMPDSTTVLTHSRSKRIIIVSAVCVCFLVFAAYSRSYDLLSCIKLLTNTVAFSSLAVVTTKYPVDDTITTWLKLTMAHSIILSILVDLIFGLFKFVGLDLVQNSTVVLIIFIVIMPYLCNFYEWLFTKYFRSTRI